MTNIELLSPVGDFDCLKSAVQNGANAIYLGVSEFNARYSAKNFTLDTLEEAVNYAKLRNVKVYLTLNTLVKNSELEEVLNIARQAYNYGVDALIVQDFGLANLIQKYLPKLPIHASTQMTIHNLEGAKHLQSLGFKRVVLSRELPIAEIEHISKNTSIETEVFIHGALCISYSGQCLFSSIIGGRSGNRGKCAQGCRLPYELLENNTKIDNGYLLSPRDVCSLEVLPQLVSAGVTSFKIEGRMKTPEYVAIVTKLYRKYLDKIINKELYSVDSSDIQKLQQVFNRGGFSTGHLENKPNHKLIYKEKPNNMGIYIGDVLKYNPSKKYIDLKLKEVLAIGDSVSFSKENNKYNISELIQGNHHIAKAEKGNIVTIGRMIGNIKKGDKIFKMSSKELSAQAEASYNNTENIKIKLDCDITIQENHPISIKVSTKNNLFFNPSIEIVSDIIPVQALNQPITKERIISQFSKTSATPFEFDSFDIHLGPNLFITPISNLNELRRKVLEKIEHEILNSFKHETTPISINMNNSNTSFVNNHKEITLLLNILDDTYDYSVLSNINRLYIPLKFFVNNRYKNIIALLSSHFKTYIYMPSIMKRNYTDLFNLKIDSILNSFNIAGFVISNLSQLELLKDYQSKYDFIGNYTLNLFNYVTATNLNLKYLTISPELNKQEINELSNILDNENISSELIVYGNLPLMTSNYCLLGKSNKCYETCDKKCHDHNHKYYLKDRMGFLFRIIPDNTQTITTIYNSKITSIDFNDIKIDSVRIDILDENIDDIQNIINTIKLNKRLEGEQYTNGNINRIV